MKPQALSLRLLMLLLAGSIAADIRAQRAPQPASAPSAPSAPARMIESDELLELITAKLTPGRRREDGDLLLEFARDWKPIPVPEGELSVNLTEQPASGPNAYFLIRFELLADKKKVGVWTAFLKGRLMRTVWVTRTAAQRGDDLAKLDLVQERRDVMNLPGSFWSGPTAGPAQGLAQNLSAGSILLPRHVLLTPVIRRGEMVDAIISDRALLVRLKVEALEDGAPGQTVRIRNNTTRKELRGKVINEGTIQVEL
jgi:flagella basal body P-ring formation protein FlgA